MTLTEEIWKEFTPGYSVSSLGYVRNDLTNRTLKAWVHPIRQDKYAYIGVKIADKWMRLAVHRVVATAFIPNNNQRRCVNHLNGIKNDNRSENLEWCSYKDNIAHAQATGLMSKTSLRRKLTWAQVSVIRTLRKYNCSVPMLMRMFSVSEPTIYSILHQRYYQTPAIQEEGA